MADRVGQQLGSYRLLRLLGRGGFAEVYLGEHVRLHRQAAVKVLTAQMAEEDAVHFEAEARTVAQLSHPHIVRVFDFAVQEGTPYLVMDYAPGGTLRQRFPRNAPQEPTAILPYLLQVANALQYAHEQRLIHRDVKPENMLLGGEGMLLLSDFGIAVALHTSRSATTQEIVGTAFYMAPEQIQAHPRPASDQYALAVAVYEWLRGERPFDGSMTEVMAKHLFTPPPPLRERVPDLSPGIEAVVLQALSKDPEDRFASVEEFAYAFEQACFPTQLFDTAPARPVPLPEAPDLPPEETTATPAMDATIHEADWLAAPTQPSAPPGAQEEPRLGELSRRRLLLGGAAGVLLLGVGATALALAHQQGPSASSSGATQQRVRPTATPLPRGTQLYVYSSGADFLPIAWSPDSKRIVAGSYRPGTVQSWGALDGSRPITYITGLSADVTTVAWSPDGSRVAAGTSDGRLYVWDAASGAQKQAIKIGWYPLPGSSGVVNSIETLGWSPGGKHLAVGSFGNLLQVRDGTSLQLKYTFDPASAGTVALGANALSWAPGNNHLVVYCGSLTKAYIWSLTSGQRRLLFTAKANQLYGLGWSPDGASIASCEALDNVSLWDVASGRQRWATAIAVGYPAIAWSPDSAYLAVVDQRQGYTALLESGTGKVAFTGFPYVEMVAWSPDGLLLAASSASGVQVLKAT